MSSLSMHPVHTHDCTTCKYMATTFASNGDRVDWYVCTSSVVARYASAGHEYTSYPFFLLDNDHYRVGVSADGSVGEIGSRIIACEMLRRHRTEGL